MTEESTFMNWYRGWVRGKTRVGLAWLGALALIASARQAPSLPGILICFAGASLRFWASGYLMKDTELSLAGPYALTRNPLYFGTFLMAVGTAISIENLGLTVVFGGLFLAVYHFVIMDEEEKLSRKFGSAFEQYRKSVPRFWPQFFSTPTKQSPASFSFALAMKNKAYEAYGAFVFLIGFVTLVSWIYQRSIQF